MADRTAQHKTPRSFKTAAWRLRLESLENRTLLSTFTISNGDVAGLIAAIHAADTDNHNNTIALAAGGSYVLSAVNNTTDGPTGLPVVGTGWHSLLIQGNGATITRDSASGTPAFRLLNVAAGAELVVDDLTLSNGLETGPAAQGGGIYSQGNLILASAVVQGNSAQGSNGADGGAANVNGGSGGSAQGGGIYQAGGSVSLVQQTVLTNNQAVGGKGGNGGNGLLATWNGTKYTGSGRSTGSGAAGGRAAGGGLYASGTSLTISGGSAVQNNQVLGGNGGLGGQAVYHHYGVHFGPAGVGADGGAAAGGGVDAENSTVKLANTLVASNTVTGGNGGHGGTGNTAGAGGGGGSAAGGGLYAMGDSLTISGGSSLQNNLAQGGPGGDGGQAFLEIEPFPGGGEFGDLGTYAGNGGAGGNAAGGGLEVLTSDARLSNVALTKNVGTAGRGGNVGDNGFRGLAQGGRGGNATGAGLNSSASSLSLAEVTVSSNSLQGGDGGNGGYTYSGHANKGGNGGDAQGGGLFLAASSLRLSNADVMSNTVRGGTPVAAVLCNPPAPLEATEATAGMPREADCTPAQAPSTLPMSASTPTPSMAVMAAMGGMSSDYRVVPAAPAAMEGRHKGEVFTWHPAA